MILFDTRDTPPDVARATLAQFDIPPLVRLPEDHVITRSFYLLSHTPGRYDDVTLWVEEPGGGNDGVSSVIIGNGDWAAAWARSPQGAYLAPGDAGRRTSARNRLPFRCEFGDVRSDRQLQGRSGSLARHHGALNPMIEAVTDLVFAPIIPWSALVALAMAALVLFAWGVFRRMRGTLVRAIPIAALLVAVAQSSASAGRAPPPGGCGRYRGG